MTNERRDEIRKNAREIVEKMTPDGFELEDDGEGTKGWTVEDDDEWLYGGAKDRELTEEEEEERKDNALFVKGFMMMADVYKKWRQEHGPNDRAMFSLRRGDGDQLTVTVEERGKDTKE